MELTPSSVLSMWAAGVAGATAAVAWWRVVGPGFVWLSGAVSLLFGVPAALAGGGAWAVAGCALALLGAAVARRAGPVLGSFASAAAAFLVAAALEAGVPASLSGALLLGGITSTMVLGHWYLVDPRLPRWALRRLSLAGGIGAVADLGVLAALGVFPWEASDLAVGVGFILLAVTTTALAAAVWSSLGEEGYPAVMAATGLSYLALLTAVGAAVVGRLLLDPPVLG